jgi:general secretion pathway protein D
MNVEFENSTIEEALDYLSVITKSYWKALSPNTIFVTQDNPNKRREHAENVAKTFYLSNVNTPQELQEIMNIIRTVSELQRVVVYTAQNAIIVRGEADQVALAEKMIRDIDKPKSEVVVDILVLEASSVFNRQLTAAIASSGLNMPITFTPRSSITVPSGGEDTNTSSSSIPLSNLGKVGPEDFAITLPSALLQAALNDTKTKILQSPQVRSVDNIKATLKIGERQPTATGSFQPGIGGVGINPLVNTQFTYLDVGVNVELTPRVHDNGEVSMTVALEISSVTGSVDLGGIDQPIIGQRRADFAIRLREGEVSLLGGLLSTQESRQVTGIPGLMSIPVVGKLFSGNSLDRQRREIMIALVPHVIRRPDISPENLRGIAVGNGQSIKLNYAPPAKPEPPAAAPSPAPGAAAPAGTAPAIAPPATAPPATAPPATAPPATAPPATAPPATAPPATATPTGQPPAAAAGTTRVRFSPAQVDTGMGNTINVSVLLDGGADVASAPMQIRFDPKVLHLNDVTRGGFIDGDAVFTKNIMNDSGVAAIQLNRMPGSPGATGSGVLVTLNFRAVGRGETTVEIPNLTVRNSQGQTVASASPRLAVNVK